MDCIYKQVLKAWTLTIVCLLPVITSYSIHYTKLYETIYSFNANERKDWTNYFTKNLTIPNNSYELKAKCTVTNFAGNTVVKELDLPVPMKFKVKGGSMFSMNKSYNITWESAYDYKFDLYCYRLSEPNTWYYINKELSTKDSAISWFLSNAIPAGNDYVFRADFSVLKNWKSYNFV